MNEKAPSALIITADDELQELVAGCLKDQKYRVIIANNATEARLKFANEKFTIVFFDAVFAGLDGPDFVNSIRHKEKMQNVKTMTPVLILGSNPEDFTRDFSSVDHVKYLQTPIDKLEFKKKVLGFTAKSDAVSNNTLTIDKDDHLIEEGGTSHEMYWVLSGKFVVTKMNEENKKIIIGEVVPGELVGEMSFLDNLPRSAGVRALEKSEVLVIPHKKFIDVLEGQPRWFRSLMQTLSQRLRNSNKIIAGDSVEIDNHSELEDKADI
jgi:CheY-like chemotaxis protein